MGKKVDGGWSSVGSEYVRRALNLRVGLVAANSLASVKIRINARVNLVGHVGGYHVLVHF